MSLSSKFKYFGVLSFYLFNIQLQAEPVQTAVISEFLTNNDKGLKDSNGQNYDWIEISNVNRENGDLEGYHLTDDPLNLTKWTFPKKEFNDDGFILVFASGKDLKDPNNDLHTNFKLSSSDGGFLALIKPDGVTIASEFNSYPRQYEDVSFGSGYGEPKDVKFLTEGDDAKWNVPSAPIDGWTETTFNDASWSSGKTGIGYDNSTKYIPHIGDGGDVKSVMRGINASIYIRIPFNLTDASGISNLTLWMKWEDGFVAYLNGKKIHSISAPDNPEWNSSSTSNRSNENDAITFFEYPVSGPLQKGQNILAIQGMNGSQSSSDFLVSPELTAKKTNLNSPQNGYFLEPTPGTINGKRIDGLVSDTKFNVNRGFYENPFELEISTKTEGAEIRYTLDGTTPSETEGNVYESPITINETTVIRAIAYKSGYSSTNIDTNTYVFPADVVKQRTMSTSITENAKYKPLMVDSLKAIPSISLSIESPNTLNTENERPLSIEMIFPDGTEGFQENAGVTLFGGYYTNFSKKNFRIYFR
ncbi:MAG: chitobiase/beta-hexosaminidase C-terminal domain-containing protein, partial [Verrucomicrobiota bacterium]|nr:chitobiase/beta-hexosaminidase C-terminal domain-containing protein [Verrucomicrobiota bacterium]